MSDSSAPANSSFFFTVTATQNSPPQTLPVISWTGFVDNHSGDDGVSEQACAKLGRENNVIGLDLKDHACSDRRRHLVIRL